MTDKSSPSLACEFQQDGARIFDSHMMHLTCTDLHHTPWIIPYLGIIGVIIAVAGAWINVIRTSNKNRLIGKKKATIDLIILEQTNEYLRSQREEFLKVKTQGDLVRWAYPKNKSTIQTKAIASVINKYEMLAIGIREHSLCENIYNQWLRQTLISDWEELSTFVGELRRRNKNYNLYENFERLALKWRQEGPRNFPPIKPVPKWQKPIRWVFGAGR
ncbi:DUF4760 domain-containing protein [Gluconobacter sp. NFX36]|uniref:DUF4760 domain-containing protein n=1 Tax=Gluconobacter sp. NFX36 TaxID=2819535 RepID=UPI003CEA4255